jgi:hypothetical protein
MRKTKSRRVLLNFSRKNKKNVDVDSFEREVIVFFLEMLNTIKLYHWKTYSYATHKATDDLYSKLGDNTDKFIEILLGKFGNRANLLNTKSIPVKDMHSPEEFKREIVKYKSYLVALTSHTTMKLMTNTDLLNIRDEMLADLNQFLYLFTLH